METKSKDEEIYNHINLDDLKLEIQEELKNIRNVKKTLRKLSKETKGSQENKFSERNEIRINAEFIRYKYTYNKEILADSISIKEHLAYVFRESIKGSKILRNAIQITGIDIDQNSADWIKPLLNDMLNLNHIFGILNENSSRNIMELTNFYLKHHNDSERGKFKLLKRDGCSDDLKNYVRKLESIEADSYVRVLLTQCGVHGITSTHSAEYFLKAFIKLYFENDSIRRHWCKSKNQKLFNKVLVKGLKGKFSSSNGFDDILLTMSGKDKSEKFNLKTVEMKVGDDLGSFFDYIRTNKNTKFTSQICDDIDSFLAIRYKQLIINNVDSELANDIIVNLSNKYKFTASGIGYNFNIKVKSDNLRNALIDAGLTQGKTNRILKGAIKQNQLISLMQHGSAHKMVKKKGYYTTIDEIVHYVEFKVNINDNNKEKYVIIKIHRDTFLPNFVIRANGKLILEIEGFSSILQKLAIEKNKTSDQYKAYLKLESKFNTVLNEFNSCLVNNNISAKEVIGNLNAVHQSIYFEIIKHCRDGLFEELSVFESGRMSHCLETISNLGQKTREQLKKYFKSKSIVPYTFHQHWQTPYSLEKAFQLKGMIANSSSVNGWMILKNRYIGKMLPNDIVKICEVANVWDEFQENSSWFQKILRDLPSPYKIPDGFNLNHLSNIIRPIIFFDKQLMTPVTVKGYNSRNQWFGIKIDINKFFEEKTSFSKYLFQFPIKVNIRGVEFSQSEEIVEAWKGRLIYTGVPEEQVNLLGTKYNLRNAEGCFNVKILFAIIFEYRNVWNEFATWIRELIQTTNEWSKVLPSSVDQIDGSRLQVVNEQIQYDNSGKGDWREVLLGLGSMHGKETWNVRKDINRSFVFPSQNELFNKLIEDIKHQIWQIIPESPQEINKDEIWDFVISNWNVL
ncbi:MAG: hypothetical protein KGD64_06745 [Candidatus Heimdallarchaeota archaeon]|nr:hypothetical protein [Candidatus Heimdallarchaeota archaeon]